MNAIEFIDSCDLPRGWSEVMLFELLTGCSFCGRRLLTTNNKGERIRDGTVTLRVFDDDDISMVAAFVLCKECDPNPKERLKNVD